METNQPTANETLFGGTMLQVTKTDGTYECVKVLQLPVRQFNALLTVQDDECKLVELYTGKPEGWADTLSVESFEAIITEGERVNADPFGRWFKRRLDRMERLVPGSTKAPLPSANLSQS
jgi:hypothetical protein